MQNLNENELYNNYLHNLDILSDEYLCLSSVVRIYQEESIVKRLQLIVNGEMKNLQIFEGSCLDLDRKNISRSDDEVFSYLQKNNEELKKLLIQIILNTPIANLETTKVKLIQLTEILKVSICALKLLKISYQETDLLPKITEIEKEIVEIVLSLECNQQTDNEIESFIRKVEACPLEEIQTEKIIPIADVKTAILAKTQSFINSFSEKLRNYWYPIAPDSNLSYVPIIQKAVEIIKNPGEQFNNTCAILYLIALKQLTKFNFTQTFLHDIHSLKNLDIEDFKDKISDAMAEYREGTPFCIQLLTGRESSLEVNHTVAILINDKQIEFYDPKGILSKERLFSDGRSLSEGLQYINEKFFQRSCTITENKTPHQMDFHNCGPLVAHYLFQRIVRGNDKSYLDNKYIPISYINFFRIGIGDHITKNTDQIASHFFGIPIEKPSKEKYTLL